MLTVIGEGLVDVVQRASGIEAHVGGSPLNVAVGLARLDHPVQFIGRYGRDAYGDSVAAHLRASSVMLPLGPDELPTSVATALIDDDGAATYTFDLAWQLPGVAARQPFLLQGTTQLHTGSIATMLAPGAVNQLLGLNAAVLGGLSRVGLRSVMSRDCVSGSPNLTLYSRTFGPSSVIISPVNSTPLNANPSALMPSIVGCKISLCTCSIISGGAIEVGAYVPMPPVFGPVSPSPMRLWSCAGGKDLMV